MDDKTIEEQLEPFLSWVEKEKQKMEGTSINSQEDEKLKKKQKTPIKESKADHKTDGLYKRLTPNNFSQFGIRPLYGDEWINRGLRKHQANFSMVICFDSEDPDRLEQLKNFFSSKCPQQYKEHVIYIYNPWDGIGEFDKTTKKLIPINSDENSRYEKELENSMQARELGLCLNKMEPELKRNKTILIMNNMSVDTMTIAEKSSFLSAVKTWSISTDLIQNRSLVILFGSSFLNIADEQTKNLIPSIQVEIGNDLEYKELINYLTKIYGISLDTEEFSVITGAIRGLNLHQAEALLRETYTFKGRFDLEQIKISKGELVKKTGILETEEPKEGFEVIGGYQPVKDFIEEKIIKVIHHPERAKKFAIPLPRGILFFGPPGTGKTLFAKALAKTIKLPFINFRTENIYSMWLGESGQRMKNAIRIAEQMSPAIVFIDEIDRFGIRTGAADSAGEETRRVFSQVLEWLGNENRKAIIIGTTNKPDDIDEAFLRTGRFDYKIPILYPDIEASLKILCIHLGIMGSPKPKPPLDLPEDEFIKFLKDEIIPKTTYYTGAELEELVNRTKRNAFEKGAEALKTEDFKNAIHSFRSNPEAREKQRSYFIELAKKYTDDETFIKDL
jgi:AAA+ superfamily predicted ATPase